MAKRNESAGPAGGTTDEGDVPEDSSIEADAIDGEPMESPEDTRFRPDVPDDLPPRSEVPDDTPPRFEPPAEPTLSAGHDNPEERQTLVPEEVPAGGESAPPSPAEPARLE